MQALLGASKEELSIHRLNLLSRTILLQDKEITRRKTQQFEQIGAHIFYRSEIFK